jgi:membrane-associated phospholipid phosphatase
LTVGTSDGRLRKSWIPISGFVVVVLIWLLVRAGHSEAADRTLFLGFAQWARSHEIVMHFLRFASWTANSAVRTIAGGLLVAGLLLFRRWQTALFAFVAMAGGAWLCSFAKRLAMRERPDLLPKFEDLHSYSFPSGHAWNGVIFYGVIALVVAMFANRRWHVPIIGLGMVMAFFVGLARIAIGVHWPTDVLAGWIGGGAWLLLCRAMLAGNAPERTQSR